MTWTTPRWCLGWNRGPHVPDGGAHIVTNLGPDVRLCSACFAAWSRTDTPREADR
jgi:hypothetical protein